MRQILLLSSLQLFKFSVNVEKNDSKAKSGILHFIFRHYASNPILEGKHRVYFNIPKIPIHVFSIPSLYDGPVTVIPPILSWLEIFTKKSTKKFKSFNKLPRFRIKKYYFFLLISWKQREDWREPIRVQENERPRWKTIFMDARNEWEVPTGNRD